MACDGDATPNAKLRPASSIVTSQYARSCSTACSARICPLPETRSPLTVSWPARSCARRESPTERPRPSPSGVGQETDDLEILGNIREFLETDDGQEFVMLNLNVYREAPEYPESVDITEAIETAAEAEDEYQRRVAPLLFARAAHPIVGVEPVFLLGGIGHFERQNWNFASMVRYRSRRDFIQMILSPAFSQDVNLKWAALARSTSMISVPVISLAMIRVIPLLILIIIGLVLDRITVRSS